MQCNRTLEVRKEEIQFSSGGIGRVGAVHEVFGHLEGMVTAQRARIRGFWIGCSHEVPHDLHRSFALDDNCHYRARGDERDQV